MSRIVSKLRKLLLPFSWLYGFGVMLRNYFYDVKIFKTTSVAVPVISVGNIVAGGTGKTPHVAYIVDVLCSAGKNVAIISRGYKRSTKGTFVVSDGKNIYGTATECGDEPYFLAQKFPEAIVIVDEHRVRAARIAVEQYCVDAIIMDDGFQHRTLHRDLDIVVLDTTYKDDGLIPSGNRREPWSSLHRSNIVIFSRWNGTTNNDAIILCAKKHTSAMIVKTKFETTSIRNFYTNEMKPIELLQNAVVVAFCGIGNPDSFFTILANNGAMVKEFIPFSDHHYFSENDIKCVLHIMKEKKVTYVLTTEKDAVRLVDSTLRQYIEQMPLWILPIETVFVEGEELFLQELQKIVS
ncbi:MAG: tetraacyldisaccharide 4'-kinase [Ignavibacteria bacterium]|nr:tetraacyldisaccharide 4'-kinase [Ignavibacteria bacterium]